MAGAGYSTSRGQLKADTETYQELHYREGPDDYYVSQLDSSSKYTRGCVRCMAPVLAGMDPTGNKVSRIHHLSGVILLERSGFREMFKRGLEYFCNTTQDNTRLAMTAGGYAGKAVEGKNFLQEYIDMINLLQTFIERYADLQLLVVEGPITDPTGETDVYFSTQRSTMRTQRPPGVESVAPTPFLARDISTAMQSWAL